MEPASKRARTTELPFEVEVLSCKGLFASKGQVRSAAGKLRAYPNKADTLGMEHLTSLPEPAANADIKDLFRQDGTNLLFYSEPNFCRQVLWEAKIKFDGPVRLTGFTITGAVFGSTLLELKRSDIAIARRKTGGTCAMAFRQPPYQQSCHDNWLGMEGNDSDFLDSAISNEFRIAEISRVTKSWYTTFADKDGFLGSYSSLVHRRRIDVQFEEVKHGCMGPAGLLYDLRSLAQNSLLHDVTFVGKTPNMNAAEDMNIVRLSGCRALLASRSDYFRACLFGAMREGEQAGNGITEVDLGEVPSALAIKIVLHFCMTGELEQLDEHPLSLYVEVHSAAQRFLLPSLANLVLHQLMQRSEKFPGSVSLHDFMQALQRAKFLSNDAFKSQLLTYCPCLRIDELKDASVLQHFFSQPLCSANPDLAAQLIASAAQQMD